MVAGIAAVFAVAAARGHDDVGRVLAAHRRDEHGGATQVHVVRRRGLRP